MTNQELYKQAILDAKAVRETAMAAARESLAEAFEPSIKEMLRLKLSEELQEDGTMEENPNYTETKMSKMGANESPAKDGPMDEATLEEILAELNELSEEAGDDVVEEELSAAEKMKRGDYRKEAAGDEDGDDDEMEADTDMADDAAADAEGAAPVSDDEQVVELTVGELKSLFRDVFAQSQGGQPAEMPAMEAGEETLEEPAKKETEISLEEILAELEEEENHLEKEAHVPGEYPVDEEAHKALQEANKAIRTMRAELQEVNLLNAKLLYVNKLWKGKSLNESQKVKILNAFDRATTVREAENIYKTLNESTIAAPKKTALKESMSFASKAIGTAPARPIVEVDSMVARWKTLAGIK